MRRASDLESRLIEWGREYGGGKYADVGWPGISPISTLMTYHGPAPQGLAPKTRTDRTPADAVEMAVRLLASQQSGWYPAQVIRVEYTLPGQPVDSKLKRLRKVGVQINGRARYSQLLLMARVHVAAALGLRFEDEAERRSAPQKCV